MLTAMTPTTYNHHKAQPLFFPSISPQTSFSRHLFPDISSQTSLPRHLFPDISSHPSPPRSRYRSASTMASHILKPCKAISIDDWNVEAIIEDTKLKIRDYREDDPRTWPLLDSEWAPAWGIQIQDQFQLSGVAMF
jgi:hypothetical protein